MTNRIIIIMSLLLVFSCSSYNKGKKCLDDLSSEISEDLKKEFLIDFKKELSCFEWDEMIFLDNHFDLKEIKNKTGIDISGSKLMGLNSVAQSDFYSFILFIKDKTVVGSLDTSGKLSLEEIITEMNNNEMALINKSDAKFITYETNDEYMDGRKVISLKFSDTELLSKYKQ